MSTAEASGFPNWLSLLDVLGDADIQIGKSCDDYKTSKEKKSKSKVTIVQEPRGPEHGKRWRGRVGGWVKGKALGLR